MQKVVDRKPEVKGGEVFATDRGWEVKHASGIVEVLVSCKGLKSFIDSKAEPVEVVEAVEQEEVTEEKPKRGRKAQ